MRAMQDDSTWQIRRAICCLAMFMVIAAPLGLNSRHQWVAYRSYSGPPHLIAYQDCTGGYGWPCPFFFRVTTRSMDYSPKVISELSTWSVGPLLANLGVIAILLAGTWYCCWRWLRSARPWQFNMGVLMGWTATLAILFANWRYLADHALLKDGDRHILVLLLGPLLLGVACTLFSAGHLTVSLAVSRIKTRARCLSLGG